LREEDCLNGNDLLVVGAVGRRGFGGGRVDGAVVVVLVVVLVVVSVIVVVVGGRVNSGGGVSTDIVHEGVGSIVHEVGLLALNDAGRLDGAKMRRRVGHRHLVPHVIAPVVVALAPSVKVKP